MKEIKTASRWPANQPLGLYDPALHHDSCGVGFIARLDGVPFHSLVEDAVQILVNLEHRGAIGGDKATGDGAGLLLEIPHDFFEEIAREKGISLPDTGEYGVGMIFLPSVAPLAERCINARPLKKRGARSWGGERCP